jgi:DNA uptake protein ComE-like DNA-binding protein
MRKIVLVSIAGLALALSACSQGSDEAATAEADAEADVSADAVAAPAEQSGRLDANTATDVQLAGAEGVSPELAAAIVAGRPYASVANLDAKLRETLSDEAATAVLVNVFVPVNLNTATREEIELIPGMTDRMVGEFLEYRPYEDMAEFDREIGKYVDEAELARLRSYVTL